LVRQTSHHEPAAAVNIARSQKVERAEKHKEMAPIKEPFASAMSVMMMMVVMMMKYST
jgi:hypothetical protein